MPTARPAIAPAAAPDPPVFARLRRIWLMGTLAISVVSVVAAVALAPTRGTSPGPALALVLVFGYAAHVASTAWFATLPEFRAHAAAHPTRFLLAPVACTAGAVALVCALPDRALSYALLPYFGWQFWHFHRQNLGLAALAAAAAQTGRLTRTERRSLEAAAIAGVAAVLTDPHLLRLPLGPLSPRVVGPALLVAFLAAVGTGLRALSRRRDRPAGFVTVYVSALLFFWPVFAFDNSYAALAGLTIAHSWQYLLMLGLLARAPRPNRPAGAGIAVLMVIATAGGLALALIAERPDATAGVLAKAVSGLYLGVVMAHFVVDAGVWRLRDPFPRRFLTAKLPYLLRQVPGRPEHRP